MTPLMRSMRAALRLCICITGLISCGGGDTVGPGDGTDPGEVIVSFNSPIPTIGAIQIVVPTTSAGPATNFNVGGAYDGYTKPVSGGTRIIIYGTFTNGDVLRFRVPDRNVTTQFTITKEAAADRVSYALYSGSDFSVTLRSAANAVAQAAPGAWKELVASVPHEGTAPAR